MPTVLLHVLVVGDCSPCPGQTALLLRLLTLCPVVKHSPEELLLILAELAYLGRNSSQLAPHGRAAVSLRAAYNVYAKSSCSMLQYLDCSSTGGSGVLRIVVSSQVQEDM